MPSSVQSVATQVVFDYLLDSQGRPLPNRAVAVTLDYSFATNASPVVFVMPVTATAVTDNNGYWQLSLVPNANINPSGTVYSVEAAGQAQYQISVPTAGGPFQTSSIVANATVTLSPATTGLTGPITVAGNETVTGNLNVQGSTTLAGTQVQGDLTIASAFRLLFLAAVSKLVPGSTSFSVRNNADSADNLLVTDAGAATVRNGLTVTAGDAVVTAGRLLVSAAAAKILGGATSLSLRNNADSADNLLLTDAGLAILRNALSVPPSAGGSLPTTSYGTVPLLVDYQTPTGASVSITVPTWAKRLEISWAARSTTAANADDMHLLFNSDTGTNYAWTRSVLTNVYSTSALNNGQAFGEAALCPAASTGANVFSNGTTEVWWPNATGRRRAWLTRSARDDAGVAGNVPEFTSGDWANTSNAIATVTFNWSSGASFASGSSFATYAYP